MKKERTTRVSLGEDRIVRRQRSDGQLVPATGQTDWKYLDAMTEKDIHGAASADPDARPRTPQELGAARKVYETDVRAIRLKRNLSQSAFARRYGLALHALQEWEQGRRRPNRYARLLLRIIDKEPDAVERALERERYAQA